MAFEDIRIVGVDRDSSVPMDGGLAQVAFLLSREPPVEWIRLFMDGVRGRDFDTVGEVVILGDVMRTEPAMARLQPFVDALKAEIAEANARYVRRYHASAAARAELDAALDALRL